MTDREVYHISSVSRRSVTLLNASGDPVTARVSGNIYRQCHPVVGDMVTIQGGMDDPVVTGIMPRGSILERTSPLGDRCQIIAANVNLVLVTVSLKSPPLKTGFIDRALVAAEWRNLESAVVINKIDLSSGSSDEELLGQVKNEYGFAGYDVFPLSCETGRGLDELKKRISGLSVVMTGPSGAGKTSIARCFNPSLDLAVGDVNRKTAKGRHTTVKARLLPLQENTYLIDTPGLRMFSVDHVPSSELCFCFREFTEPAASCRFRNCLHDTEPGCAVHEAAESGNISKNRYRSYLGLLAELRGAESGARKKRRGAPKDSP